jgi:hypothetical protein
MRRSVGREALEESLDAWRTLMEAESIVSLTWLPLESKLRMYPPSGKFSVENVPAWTKAARAARTRVDVKCILKVDDRELLVDG